MSLNAKSILDTNDLPQEKVNVPEWGGDVFVRTMSGEERDAFEAAQLALAKNDNEYSNVRARLAVSTVCDESGKLMFKPSDAPKLGKKSCKALDRIFGVASKLNGLSKQDVEDLKKN